MYTFTREVTFKSMADVMRAVPIVQSIVRYYKESHGLDVRLLWPVSGGPTRLRFVSEVPSMDAQHALQMKAIRDPALQKLLAEMSPMIDGSKTCDEIWQA